MPKLSTAERRKLEQMQDACGTPGRNETLFHQILIKKKWDVNAAIDHVFDQNLLSGAAAASSSASRGSYNE